jgi:hypothetical protein
MDPLSRSILVNVPCIALQGGEVDFPDVGELREGVVVTGIEAYTDVDLGVTPQGGVVLTAADGLKITVSLADKSLLQHRDMPHSTLIPRLNGGIWKEVTPFLVNFQRSKVKFGTPAAAATAFFCPFLVHYRKL